MLTLYDRALAFHELGYSVIPLRWRDKRPDGQALLWAGAVDDDGYPTWNPYKTRRATDAELRMWFAAGGRRNLGIVTGFNGLTVIDFDSFDAWDAWQLVDRNSPLRSATTYRVWTARGVHVYMQTQEPVTSYSVGQIDVKARWGYVLGEGSIHPSGHEYHGNGGLIPTVDALADVFCLDQPARPVARDCDMRPVYADPWDSADNATGPASGTSIEAIKLRFTPADILGLGASRGRVERIKCPLHNGTNPSEFTIYSDGHWRCWSCGRYGDALDLYAALHNVPLAEAVAELERQL